MSIDTLAEWHRLVREHQPEGLNALLADTVMFHSPIVHKPHASKALALAYLQAAFNVFFNPSFRYVREVAGARDAVLEFTVLIDGISVNGVDMIHWDEEGRIDDFKVMIRPLKAVNLIHQRMAAMLPSHSGLVPDA